MSQPRIVIAGGSGFLGQSLLNYLEKDYGVINLTRNPKSKNDFFWDGKSLGEWTKLIEGAFAVINMAGRTVNCRYTEKNKKQILDSRIFSTRVLGEAIQKAEVKPKIWINSSTATIYQDTRGDKPANTEKEGIIGNDFSMNIAKAWEEEFFKWKIEGLKQIAIRSSIVMGKEGGAFPVMAKLAKRGLCSPQGSGEQWISWIHIDDFCRAVEFLLHQGGEGIYNLSTPGYLQNRDFNRLLKKELKPLITLPQPKWILKLGAMMIGTETELILKSRKAHPERLIQEGFTFTYEKFEDALPTLIA